MAVLRTSAITVVPTLICHEGGTHHPQRRPPFDRAGGRLTYIGEDGQRYSFWMRWSWITRHPCVWRMRRDAGLLLDQIERWRNAGWIRCH